MNRNSVTIYGSSYGASTIIRALTGDLRQVSMWNTITNVLRMVNAIICVLGTDDDEYFMTADDEVFVLKV